jgi:CheY-like chemotaxis protein
MEILVVEDDPDSQAGLCALLESHGARVTCAESAEEALRLAGAGLQYDALVSDLELPGHDGLWLMRELKRSVPPDALPWAVLLTGSARPGIEDAAVQAGFNVCLRKPAPAETLLRAVIRADGTNPP